METRQADVELQLILVRLIFASKKLLSRTDVPVCPAAIPGDQMYLPDDYVYEPFRNDDHLDHVLAIGVLADLTIGKGKLFDLHIRCFRGGEDTASQLAVYLNGDLDLVLLRQLSRVLRKTSIIADDPILVLNKH